jgi:hypothetical protein
VRSVRLQPDYTWSQNATKPIIATNVTSPRTTIPTVNICVSFRLSAAPSGYRRRAARSTFTCCGRVAGPCRRKRPDRPAATRYRRSRRCCGRVCDGGVCVCNPRYVAEPENGPRGSQRNPQDAVSCYVGPLASSAGFPGRSAVQGAAPANLCCADALASKATAALLDMQMLHAPHIAEAEDAAMTRMEERVDISRPQPRPSIGSRKRIARSSGSRAGTAMSDRSHCLGRKWAVTATAHDQLRALEETLAKRGFTATR